MAVGASGRLAGAAGHRPGAVDTCGTCFSGSSRGAGAASVGTGRNPIIDFEAEYQRIRAIANAADRGRQVEQLIFRLFRRYRFDATLNPGAAWPRQTDLFASYDSENYLVEVKWQSTPAGLQEVDEVRTRLRDIPPGVVGVLISFSGFTDSAVERVEAKRTEPVLLVDRDEVLRLFRESADLHRLLARKVDLLIRHGKAHRSNDVGTPAHAAPAQSLPTGDRYYADLAGNALPWMATDGGFSSPVFTTGLLGATWAGGSDGNLGFDVRLSVKDVEGLRAAAASLAELGWLAGDVDWSILQATRNWHGTGVASFVAAVERQQERCEGLEVHHTEEGKMFGAFPGGHLTLSADLAVSRRIHVRHTYLSLRLDGIPFDASALRRLVSTLQADDTGLAFRPLAGPPVTRKWLGESPTGDLTVTGYILERDEIDPSGDPWVTSVVVVNPFGGQVPALGELEPLVTGSGHLVCALHDQHPLSDGQHRTYRVTSAEYATTSDCHVARFIADW